MIKRQDLSGLTEACPVSILSLFWVGVKEHELSYSNEEFL